MEVYVKGNIISPGKLRVLWQHNMPLDPKHGLGMSREGLLADGGYLVEDVAKPIEPMGKRVVTFVDIETNTMYHELEDTALTPEQKLQQLTMSKNDIYLQMDKQLTPLEELRKAKLKALDEMCNYTIVSGFDHELGGTMYHFSGSLAAQANFTGTKVRFMANEITEVEWTAVNKATGKEERIILDPVTFKPIADKMFDLVDSSVKKLRNTLQPQVEAATTNAEVDVINW